MTAKETGKPEALEVCQPERLAVKAMPEQWRKGRRLAFDLKVRPVRRLASDLVSGEKTFKKGSELDVYLAEVLRKFPDKQLDNQKDGQDREKVYQQWLIEQFEGMAILDTVRIARIEQRRPIHRHQKHRTIGPNVIFQGYLSITNSSKFNECLARGIGRHRAYGYGMLLLRPDDS